MSLILYSCAGEDRCKASNLDCESATDCTVDCGAKSACADSVIQGLTTASLTIECSNEDSCKHLHYVVVPAIVQLIAMENHHVRIQQLKQVGHHH